MYLDERHRVEEVLIDLVDAGEGLRPPYILRTVLGDFHQPLGLVLKIFCVDLVQCRSTLCMSTVGVHCV